MLWENQHSCDIFWQICQCIMANWRKTKFYEVSFCCFLGNPADWFLWPCVFRGLRQCEPVWHRAGYPGCKPDIRHSAEPDSGAGYSRLASGSTFKIFLQSVMLQKHSLYLNSNRKKYLAIPFFFPVIYFINIRFYNVMNYVVLHSCDKL